MKRLIAGILIINILILSFNINTYSVKAQAKEWPSQPSNISAESAVVMDISSGQILYEKNMHKKEYPASITKIMTTLLCLENSSPTETVTFSKEAVLGIERNSSHIGIDIGEQLSMQNCLYGIMLMSANEACLGVAEHVGGSINKFVDMMNKKATDLGCQGTHFANPNGLFNENHYTTAYDMALISRAAMQNQTFRQITGTKRYNIPPTNKNETRYLYNKQQMLNPNKYPQYGYDYCIGGKTGYTDLCRWTLVTFAKKGDMELLCVVMRTAGPPPSEPNEYTDTRTLLDYGFDKFQKINIGNTSTTDNQTESPLFTSFNPIFSDTNSPLKIQNGASIDLPKGAKLEDAEKKVEYYNDVQIKDGENVIGKVSYTYQGKEVGSSNIIYNKSNAPTLKVNQSVTDAVQAKLEESQQTGKSFPWKIFWVVLLIVVAALATGGFLFLSRKNGSRKMNLRFNFRRRKRNGSDDDIFKLLK